MCKKLMNDERSPLYERAVFSISATTRKIRASEVDGVDYFFLTREEFEVKIRNNEFLEHATVFDNLYGTPTFGISKEKHTIFDIDYQGQVQIKSKAECLSIFLIPPSIDALQKRIYNRGDIMPADLEKRVLKAPTEIENAINYDYIVLNDNIEQAFLDVCGIIKSALLASKFCDFKNGSADFSGKFQDIINFAKNNLIF